jgi:hypothetical protein
MERYFGLAELYSKHSQGDVAFSALPTAPVQPCADAPRRLRSALARLRRPARVRLVPLRTARLSSDC